MKKISSGEIPNMEGLRGLFLATMQLQEISLSNGWADEFIAISSQFDKIYAELTA